VPRFFTNVRRGGVLIPDPEGEDLPDAEAARVEALETVREMMRLPHVYGDLREWQRDEFVVTDEAGAVVLTVPFMPREEPGD
jgi:hypothetical protein